jgi:hypothetical protein
MRFLTLYKPADTKSMEAGVPPSQEEMVAMGKLIEDGFKSGVLLAAEGCQPSSKGARVRRSGGKVTVTDGPFAESKEIIGGLAIIRASSKEEAIEQAKRFLDVAGDGVSEIWQLHEQSDFAPESTPGR